MSGQIQFKMPSLLKMAFCKLKIYGKKASALISSHETIKYAKGLILFLL